MPNEEVYGSKFTIDITDLKTGMAEANRLIRVADSSFKAAAAGIGDWSKSADGLSAKIKSLNTIMGIQNQKISALTKEYEKVAAEKGKNSREAQELEIKINKETESFNKNQRQLKECEDALKDVESGSKKTGTATEEAGRKAESSGGKFNTFAVTAGTAIGNLIATGIENLLSSLTEVTKKITDIGVGFYDSTNRIEALLGVTEEEAKRLGDIAKQVYKDAFGENIQEITNNLAILKQNIADLTDNELKNMSEGIYTINDLFGTDFGEVAKTAATLMQNFEVSGSQALDIITYGFQNGADKSGDLLDTLNEYSNQFKGMGFDAQTFVNILVNGAKNGAFNVDKVADAVKEFGIRAKDGSEQTKNAFKELGFNADDLSEKFAEGGKSAQDAFEDVIEALKDIDDPLEQNIIGASLFGTQWEDVGSKVVLALGDTTDAFNDMDGAAQKATDNLYDTAQSKWTSIERTLTTAFSPAIGALADVLNNKLGSPEVQNAIQSVSDKIGEFAGKITDKFVAFLESGDFEKLADGMIALGDAITDAVIWFVDEALPKIQESLQWIVDNKDEIVIAMEAIGTALAVVGFASGNVAVGLAGIALIIPGVTSGMNDLNDTTSNTILSIKGTLDGFVNGDMRDILENIPGIFNGMYDETESITLKRGASILGGFTTMGINIISGFYEMGNRMVTDFITMVEGFKTAMTNIGNAFVSLWNSIVTNIKTLVNMIIRGINTVISGINTFISGLNKIKLPDFLGGGGINIPTVGYIPYWAKEGGIFDKASIIGVGEAGPEAVIPINKLSDILIDVLRGVFGPNAANMGGTSGVGRSVENGAVTTTQTIQFTQNNYSPKSLSRREIYRQGRQLSQLLAAQVRQK